MGQQVSGAPSCCRRRISHPVIVQGRCAESGSPRNPAFRPQKEKRPIPAALMKRNSKMSTGMKSYLPLSQHHFSFFVPLCELCALCPSWRCLLFSS